MGSRRVGAHRVTRAVKNDYTELPIYITENGAAFDDYVDPNGHVLDHDRVSYLEEHISAVHDAIKADVNVQGYFVWSCSITSSGPTATHGASESSGSTFRLVRDCPRRVSRGTPTRFGTML